MLKGKTAIVTGGSRGIGKAIALELARQGAQIAIVYYGNDEAAQITCQSIKELGQKAIAYPCDVSDYEKTKELIVQILTDFGSFEILINNAGIIRDGLLLSLKEADYDLVLNTNLKGAYNLLKHSAPFLLRQKKGRIINISSVAGLMGNAGQTNYSAAKAGLIGLTKAAARELASRNITCNAIAPGLIDTEMTKNLPQKAKEALLGQIPLKKAGSPQDIASLAAFLSSDQAGYITGEIIKVDGGLYI